MQYNFSNILSEKEKTLQEFIDTYTACVKLEGDERLDVVERYYGDIFGILDRDFEVEELLECFADLAQFKISVNIPYTIMSNEIYGLENVLIANINKETLNVDLLKLIKLFKQINNRVAHVYLLKYVDELVSLNNRRRSSLGDLVEKNLISHYESHLIWLSDLAEHIRDQSTTSFPELNHNFCTFGKWLHGEAKQTIQNNSKYKIIENMHKNLHMFAGKIFNILELGEYHVLITYLEKCELISLGIGTELALLDHILINKKISKDALTGALNRHSLHNLFEHEYELALATSTSFILAMCDLDYFKNINDTYGHIVGDHVLKHFVSVVKENLRNSDVIIRYGGEEFIIMLPAVNRENGYNVLNKIRKSFQESVTEYQDKKVQSTVSIGMMEITPKHSYNKNFIEEYIMMVDQNLYIAKENGRNRVEYC